jgi:hypothetical protein
MPSTRAEMDTLLGLVASGYTTRFGRVVQPSLRAEEALVDYYGVELAIVGSIPKVQEILEGASSELEAQLGAELEGFFGGQRSGGRSGGRSKARKQRGGAFLADMKLILNHLSAAAACVVKSVPRLPILGSVTDAVIVNLKDQVGRPVVAGQQANAAATRLVNRLFDGITDSTDSTMKVLLLILASTISGAALGVPGAAATLQLGLRAGVAVAPSVAKLAALKVVAVALFKVTYSVTNGVAMVLGTQVGRIAEDVNTKFTTFLAQIDAFFVLASKGVLSLDQIMKYVLSIPAAVTAVGGAAYNRKDTLVAALKMARAGDPVSDAEIEQIATAAAASEGGAKAEEVAEASTQAAAIEEAPAPPALTEVVNSAASAAEADSTRNGPSNISTLRRLVEKYEEREYDVEKDILNEILALTNKLSPSRRGRDRRPPTRQQVLERARSILQQEGGRKTNGRKTKKRSIRKRRNTRR